MSTMSTNPRQTVRLESWIYADKTGGQVFVYRAIDEDGKVDFKIESTVPGEAITFPIPQNAIDPLLGAFRTGASICEAILPYMKETWAPLRYTLPIAYALYEQLVISQASTNGNPVAAKHWQRL
jgi:hypothetical protein